MGATLKQFQSWLLEIAFIPLLESAGYQAITQPGNDPTLKQGKHGLEVYGRSGRHQIDGIANFFFKPPFSHRYRLLVEGKYQTRPVGLSVIRNAVGVLKDVSELWVIHPPATMTASRSWKKAIPKGRYHYQYAIIASTRFTGPAEAYAFAHDVYLIPMARSRHFQQILHAIDVLATAIFENTAVPNHSPLNRKILRHVLENKIMSAEEEKDDEELRRAGMPELAIEPFRLFRQMCQRLKIVVVATLGEQIPLVLAPDPERIHEALNAFLEAETAHQPPLAEIHKDQETGGWLLHYHGENLFSFDLPPHLLKLALAHGGLAFEDENVQNVRLDATLVDLGKQIEGFDHRVHNIELSIPRESFRQFQVELDPEPEAEEEDDEE